MPNSEAAPKNGLVRILKWVAGIAVLTLSAAEFVLTNLPKLSMDVSGPSRPSDLMSTIFSLSNQGSLPVYDVKAV